MNFASNLPHPEAAFQAFTNILKHVESPKAKEQRITVRKQILQPIVVQPRDSDLNPIGEAVEGLSRDVSVSGVGFFLTVPIESPYVSIQFTPREDSSGDTIFAEVVHQSQRGPVFVIGSKTMVNWDV